MQRVIEDALWDGQGTIDAAAQAAEQLRELGYRMVEDGPIEAAARRALSAVGGDDALAALRRETAFRAAAVMDTAKAVPFFKSAAEVLRITVGDLLAASPAKGGEADELAKLLGAFGPRGRTGGRASVGDPEEPP